MTFVIGDDYEKLEIVSDADFSESTMTQKPLSYNRFSHV